ncbi:MAG TPA: zf-HC2 domain-containing protein [Woeseiaceae bacterium]|nr:zf-HC2 domain-containing protein [Woeseiaceae bacterium]
MSTASCPHGDESFIVADYLAGRLSGAEASAFEEHTFNCDRCFEELQLASEVRAADTGEPAAARPRPGTTWLLLAVAATVLLAAGLWLAQPLFETPDPVYRDAGNGAGMLTVDVTHDDGRVILNWTPVQGVDQYEIRVFSDAGDPVFEQQSRETSLDLPVTSWQGSSRAGAFYVQVIALDDLHQTIVQSDLEPL